MAEASESLERTDELLGRVVNDRYRIVSVIARGGMGKVYEAEQLPLGRRVAFKVLDPKHSGDGDPEFHKRFFLEASTAARLSHPNTVTIFDYGHTGDGVYFIAMELVEGRTLASLLKEAALPAERAIHIAMQICRSLREAHAAGVIHRDLKPANVLLTTHADEEDFVKVLDFGLVKDVGASEDSELTKAGMFMGSPKYMSPEQIQGGSVDGRSDVYSLGVILYQMLTGSVPFEGPTAVQTLMLHMQSEVPAMNGEGRPYVPPMLEQIIRRCLAKDRTERFDSMNDVLAALKHVLASLGMPVPSSTQHALSGEMSLGARNEALAVTPSGVLAPSPPFGMATPSHVRSVPVEPPPTQTEVLPEELRTGRSRPLLWTIGGVLAVAAAVGAFAHFSGEPSDDPLAPTAAEVAAPTRTGPLAAEPPPTAPRDRMILNLRSEPSGAQVQVGDLTYGPTPAQVEWLDEDARPGRSVTFRFELDGHDPVTVTRTLGGDELDVQVTLDRTEARADRRRTTPMTEPSAMQSPSGMGSVQLPGDYLDSPY